MVWVKRNSKDILDLIPQGPNLALNTSRDEASATALGNLFQCLTMFKVKSFFLIPNVSLILFKTVPTCPITIW